MFRTNLLLQKLEREMTMQLLVIVTVLALCTFSDNRLSMYQISYNSLQYLRRYAPDKLSIAKIKNGSNSVNAGDRVMILAFCNFPQGPLSVYQASLNYLQYF